jgi:hypothetical protein
VWNATQVTRRGIFTIVLCLASTSARAQAPPRQPSIGRETWYEFLLKKCNPSNFDYGAWLEKKREAFLEASVKEPHFWYSLWVTAWSLFVMAAYAKLYLDHRRKMRATAEMLADIYSHDSYSRQMAKEAIERHNHHIEQCNRAMEAAESGDGRPGWGSSEADGLRTELQRVASQLEATTQERNKLQEELRQKSLIVADLSTRLDVLSKKVSGTRGVDSGAAEPASTGTNGDNTRFVGQINRLQEELYSERQKNKRLKGA